MSEVPKSPVPHASPMPFSDLFSKPRKALFGQLTLYYLIVISIEKSLERWLPGFSRYLYGWERRLEEETFPGAEQISSLSLADFSELHSDTAIRLFLSIMAAILLMVPVTWVYIGTRRRKGLDQAMIETLLILPISVAGVVTIVQHSLALAFSLTGIFAGVQFRSRLKMYADAHFIFIAIGMGFAAGIGAPHIAAVTSMCFVYATYIIWRMSYGSESSERHLRKTEKRKRNPRQEEDEEELHS